MLEPLSSSRKARFFGHDRVPSDGEDRIEPRLPSEYAGGAGGRGSATGKRVSASPARRASSGGLTLGNDLTNASEPDV